MNNRIFILVISLIVLGALGLIVLGGSSQSVGQTSKHIYGFSKKGVVLQEVFSLGCPRCAEAHPNLKILREEYADRVAFQVIHFPSTAQFPKALLAHRSLEAASKQGSDKFWALHDKLFEEYALWGDPNGPPDDPYPHIEEFVKELGLDLEKFRTDFRSPEVNATIQADEAYIRQEFPEVKGTPSFILNDQVLDSNKFRYNSLESMRKVLDEALALEGEATGNTNSLEESPTTTPSEQESPQSEENNASQSESPNTQDNPS